MSGIPEATPVILTEAERAELEGLARSTKTEYRLRRLCWHSVVRLLGLRQTRQRVDVLYVASGNWQCAADHIMAHAGQPATIVIGHLGGRLADGVELTKQH